MAKAKKPASRSKSNPKTPSSDAAKPDSTPKTPDAAIQSKASQTAAKAETVKSDATAAKPADKTPASAKPAEAKSADSKVVDKAPETKPTPDAKDANKGDAKPAAAAAAKPAEAKTDPKPVTPAKDTKPASTVKETAKPTPPAEAKKPAATTPAPKPQPTPQPEKRRGVFWPLVFGGLIAGGLGFAAAEMNVLNTRVDVEALQATIADQQAQIDAFEPADLTGVESGIAGLSETAEGFETRIVDLEARPLVVNDDGDVDLEALADEYAQRLAGQFEGELAELKGTVEAQNEEIARLLENAQSVEEATANAARDAAIQAAAAKLTAALGSGAPYDEVLSELSSAGIAELPPALVNPAADGVETLLNLQTAFPDAARAALSAARASGVDAGTGGVGGFLKRQLGARSVAPRDGDDPDAVLSRAEAAVRGGQVSGALDELDALPEDVQGAMEDWLAQARTRAGAEQAVQDLSERLSAN